MWGRDNVIHDIDFSYDYRYRNGTAEQIPVPVRGQFGIGQDDYGRLYCCRSTDQLRCDLYGPAYGLRSGNLPEVPWANVQIAQDEEVWPSHPNITNRGYQPRCPRAAHRRESATRWHAPGVHRGLLAADLSGGQFPGRVLWQRLRARTGGQSDQARPPGLQESEGSDHDAVNAYQGSEFLTSTDSRFRPVALLNAPDGSLLVVDMYRGVLEEYHYTTTYLMNQSLARGLAGPMFGLGRIWKITYEKGPLEQQRPDFDRMPSNGLVGLLGSANGWWRDTAQQELVERGDWSAVPALEELARHSSPSVVAAFGSALDARRPWQAATPALLKEALADPAPKVRAAAIRLHERLLGGAGGDALLDQLAAVLHDPEPEVQVQLALTLGEAKGSASLETMAQLLVAAGSDPYRAEGARHRARRTRVRVLPVVGWAPRPAGPASGGGRHAERPVHRDRAPGVVGTNSVSCSLSVPATKGGGPKWSSRGLCSAGFDPLS